MNYRNSKSISRFFWNKVNQNVQTVNIDVLNFNDVKKLLEDTNPDIVVDLTGLVNVSKSTTNPKESFESSALTTLNILEAIKISKFDAAYINHSSDKVYANNKSPFREDMKLFPDHIYDVGKLTQEVI